MHAFFGAGLVRGHGHWMPDARCQRMPLIRMLVAVHGG
jgi:hypothetical protein